jgi:glycosyltransferase involved in cell wall biosynthesis
MLKIVIAVEEFDPTKGYLEYYLARELTKLGHKVFVLTFGLNKGLSKTLTNEGFEVITISYSTTVYGYHLPDLAGISYLFHFIGAERPDLIHCQPLDSPLSLILLWWKSFFKYKLAGSIMTQLNIVFSPWGIKKKFLFSISKIVVKAFVLRRSAMVFAKNIKFAEILSLSYGIPRQNFVIIPLGSDLQLFKFDPKARIQIRKKLGISKTEIVLVYSGKIDSTKGLDILVKALAPIVMKNNKVKLLIIGRGDSSIINYLGTLISKYALENNVIFYPWVNKSLLPSFYSASDIGVWPGLSSISIVDAASNGLPLVICRYPVETFAIENKNGFAFTIGDQNELRSHLEKLIYDKSLRFKMGLNSRLLVENTLNWQCVASKYVKAYKEALD